MLGVTWWCLLFLCLVFMRRKCLCMCEECIDEEQSLCSSLCLLCEKRLVYKTKHNATKRKKKTVMACVGSFVKFVKF